MQTDMNSISNGWDSTKRAETLYFHCGPQVRTKKREKGKRKKNTGMNKSKANTLIHIHMYIYTHPRTYKHI